MKIAFIHNEKKLGTGAHYLNDLMAIKLWRRGVYLHNFYPKAQIMETPARLKGIANLLFFYSLLERRDEVLKFDMIQGTTYTPLPFLAFDVPVISHFGSTTHGFLASTPLAKNLERETRKIWYELRKTHVIKEVNLKTRRPLRDIAEMEFYVARRANMVIATSEKVKNELVAAGVPEEKVRVIHNMIEDYWFDRPLAAVADNPTIVFLGRIGGGDAFTLKLKGIDRLAHLYVKFPETDKVTVCITRNKTVKAWLDKNFKRHTLHANIRKDLIRDILRPLRGGVLFLPSRYEGFSLSLVEGMSQGLVPVAYPVGVAPEIIVNGENGFLVRSQREAVRRTGEVLANFELRSQMSYAARRTTLQFTSDKIAEQLVKVYQDELLTVRTRRRRRKFDWEQSPATIRKTKSRNVNPSES